MQFGRAKMALLRGCPTFRWSTSNAATDFDVLDSVAAKFRVDQPCSFRGISLSIVFKSLDQGTGAVAKTDDRNLDLTLHGSFFSDETIVVSSPMRRSRRLLDKNSHAHALVVSVL